MYNIICRYQDGTEEVIQTAAGEADGLVKSYNALAGEGEVYFKIKI